MTIAVWRNFDIPSAFELKRVAKIEGGGKDLRGTGIGRLRMVLKRVPGLVPAVRFVRSWTVSELRALRLLPADQAALLLQPSSHTSPDRYAEIFGFVRDRLEGVVAPRLLSYGCSTGAEAFALRNYFPDADIVAVDINAHSIRLAEKRLAARADARISFKVASSPNGFAADSFDAIFCMAVFRHGRLLAERPDRCDGIISFATVETLATDLTRCLKPGGYLAIWHTQFRLSDMAPFARFTPQFGLLEGVRANQPIYGPDNRRIDSVAVIDAVFRKREN